MKTSELLNNVDKLHTTKLGADRIQKNLGIMADDVVDYCKKLLVLNEAVIERKGKNWYVGINGVMLTINAYSYTIITAHKIAE